MQVSRDFLLQESTHETASNALITQRSQVQILPPLPGKTPPEIRLRGRFLCPVQPAGLAQPAISSPGSAVRRPFLAARTSSTSTSTDQCTAEPCDSGVPQPSSPPRALGRSGCRTCVRSRSGLDGSGTGSESSQVCDVRSCQAGRAGALTCVDGAR